MMLHLRTITLILILTQLFIVGLAQHHNSSCGTKIPMSQIMGLQAITVPEDPECTFINKVNRTLQISLHICLNGNGGMGIMDADIQNALQRLNSDFSPCGLQFEYCTTTIMPNHEFDTLAVASAVNEETHMTILHYEPNTINVYLVDMLYNVSAEDIDGYTYYPNTNNKDVIVMEKSAFNNNWGHFSHQMGHYFGLYHTDENQFGLEHPNGSNCQTAGDRICDTKADPGGDSDSIDQCNYAGPTFQFAPGIWYVPPTDNLMSSYFSTSFPVHDCRCRFTPQQYNRMIQQYLAHRSYLW